MCTQREHAPRPSSPGRSNTQCRTRGDSDRMHTADHNTAWISSAASTTRLTRDSGSGTYASTVCSATTNNKGTDIQNTLQRALYGTTHRALPSNVNVKTHLAAILAVAPHGCPIADTPWLTMQPVTEESATQVSTIKNGLRVASQYVSVFLMLRCLTITEPVQNSNCRHLHRCRQQI